MWKIIFLLTLQIFLKPGQLAPQGSDYFSSGENLFRLPITIHKGTIGVNLLGFHASAGLLGGLLAENGSPGGPHAEASTPVGQSGGAGVGFRIENGNTIGYVYAEAQLGQKVVGTCILISNEYPDSIKILKWDECAETFNITTKT